MKPHLQLVIAAALAALSSCADDPPATGSRQPLSKRLDEKSGYRQDASGNWIPQSNKRSSYESQNSPSYANDTYQKKDYRTDSYDKKSWWGNKNYDRKAYNAATDGSAYQQTSRFSDQSARESGNRADHPGTYPSGEYATGSAREAGRDPLAKPTDAETDQRRKVYVAPEVMDWRAQRALSLEQSKGLLGR